MKALLVAWIIITGVCWLIVGGIAWVVIMFPRESAAALCLGLIVGAGATAGRALAKAAVARLSTSRSDTDA